MNSSINKEKEIIDAFCQTCGQNYRRTITDRIQNMRYIPYTNIMGMYMYLIHLRTVSTNCTETKNCMIERMESQLQREKKRKSDILERKKLEIYEEIYSELPPLLKRELKERLPNNEERIKLILGEYLGSSSNIEAFSEENTRRFPQLESDNWEKEMLLRMRKEFLESIGIIDGLDEYGNVKKEYRKYLPLYCTISQIRRLKEKAYLQAEQEYYEENRDYQRVILKQAPSYKQEAINMMREASTGIMAMYDEKTRQTRGILLQTTKGEVGGEDYILLHELFHIITLSGVYKSGIDILTKSCRNQNRYYPRRKYEVLNEVFTDYFAIEVLKQLTRKGVSILEPLDYQEEEKINNMNTPNVLKQLLAPFISKYQDIILQAMITGNIEILTQQIGKKNFEKLNDIINHLYAIIRKEGTKQKTSKKQMLMEEVEEIYRNINSRGEEITI